MKYLAILCCLVQLASVQLLAVDPPAEDIATKAYALWVAKDYAGMHTYIASLSPAYDDYVPAIVARAFYDGIFLGKLQKEKAGYARLEGALPSVEAQYSLEFKAFLGDAIRTVHDELRYQAQGGFTAEQTEQNANPAEVREIWIEYSIQSLEALKAAPKIFLSQP